MLSNHLHEMNELDSIHTKGHSNHMQLQTAKLVKGSETNTEDGITGAMHCVIRLPDGLLKKAILKRGAINEVIAEVYCALLLRAWGLPVPDPFLIEEDGIFAFASAQLDYPNLKQSLGYSKLLPLAVQEAISRKAIRILFSLASTTLAIAADEAIDNKDRNLGNVLWDGESEAWIDHAFCLGQGHLADQNKLCNMAIGTDHEDDAKRGGVAHALILNKGLPREVQTAIEEHMDCPSNADIVLTRMTDLTSRVLKRFPTPIDLFNAVE